jgi:hypothetical protein
VLRVVTPRLTTKEIMMRRPSRARYKPRARRVLAGLLASATLFASLGLVAATAATPAVAADALTGGAFGVQAGIGNAFSIPATPSVTLGVAQESQKAAGFSGLSGNILTVGALVASTGTPNWGPGGQLVTSSASVASAQLALLAGSGLDIGAVSSTCTSGTEGSTASASVTGISVGGHALVNLPTAPNSAIAPSLLGGLGGLLSITLDAQSAGDAPGSTAVTLDAVQITLDASLGSPYGSTVIDLAQSTCGATGADIETPPTVTDVDPGSGSTAGGNPVTITGTGFGGVSAVDFGSTPAGGVDVVSPTEITATAPAGPAGTVDVSVTNGFGTSPTGPADRYTYVAPPQPAPPSVTGITPSSGVPAGGNPIEVVGANLCNVTSVTFGTFPGTDISVSPDCTTVTVTVPAGEGTVPVVVTTNGGTATSPVDYTYTEPGYWMAAADGGVFSFGGAQFYGSMGGRPLNLPIVAMAETPDHRGYWLFAGDGGVFSFGDAQFYGSVPGILGPEGRKLNGPIVAVEATPDGKGYRMFASDGGVFDFGDAAFEGSLPGIGVVPNKPVVGAVSVPVCRG